MLCKPTHIHNIYFHRLWNVVIEHPLQHGPFCPSHIDTYTRTYMYLTVRCAIRRKRVIIHNGSCCLICSSYRYQVCNNIYFRSLTPLSVRQPSISDSPLKWFLKFDTYPSPYTIYSQAPTSVTCPVNCFLETMCNGKPFQIHNIISSAFWAGLPATINLQHPPSYSL